MRSSIAILQYGGEVENRAGRRASNRTTIGIVGSPLSAFELDRSRTGGRDPRHFLTFLDRF